MMIRIPKAALLLTLICIFSLEVAEAQVRLNSEEAEKLLIDAPVAEYPKIAIAAHAKGLVKVEVTISDAGLVTAVKAISGHPLLQNAAVKAVKAYKINLMFWTVRRYRLLQRFMSCFLPVLQPENKGSHRKDRTTLPINKDISVGTFLDRRPRPGRMG
jgi:TonB family protein